MPCKLWNIYICIYIYIYKIYIYFVCVCVTGVWTQAFAIYHLRHTSSLLALVILEIQSCVLHRQAWSTILFCAFHHCWDDSWAHLCPAVGLDGILWTICLSWPETLILPVSAFQVARIIGLHYGTQLSYGIFCHKFIYRIHLLLLITANSAVMAPDADMLCLLFFFLISLIRSL
jgi:hypothetical protein